MPSVTQINVFEGPYLCPECHEEITELEYSCQRTEYGTTRISDEESESNDYGDSENWNYKCPVCNHDTHVFAVKEYSINNREEEPEEEEEEEEENTTPTPQTTSILTESNQITLTTQNENASIEHLKPSFPCPKCNWLVELEKNTRTKNHPKDINKQIIFFPNPIQCPNCDTIINKQITTIKYAADRS